MGLTGRRRGWLIKTFHRQRRPMRVQGEAELVIGSKKGTLSFLARRTAWAMAGEAGGRSIEWVETYLTGTVVRSSASMVS